MSRSHAPRTGGPARAGAVALLLAVAVAACAGDVQSNAAASEGSQSSDGSGSARGAGGPFALTSPAFVESGPFPVRFSGDGDNVSPPLEWSGAPAGTRSFALILIDPDVPWGQEVPAYGEMPPPGTQPADHFAHWIVTDIPASRMMLPAGASPGNMPEGLLEPSNSFGLFGGDPNQYGGPAPPPGTKAHEYRFILYALDVPSLEGVTAESDFAAVTSAMAGHVLATATLSGYFGH